MKNWAMDTTSSTSRGARDIPAAIVNHSSWPLPLVFSDESSTATDQPVRIAVVLTCFNRKEKTLAALSALAANNGLKEVILYGVLVDDGSTDGTAEAVSALFPWVNVVPGSGNLFWCRGMHMAFDVAMQGNHDYYLWLNDDTMLRPDAVSRLLACEADLRIKHGKPVVVVGSTGDAATGAITYGGELQASSLKRTTFLRIVPGDVAQRCDSMTGNIVLIPREVAQIVGNLDPLFEHAMGDTDYALRVRKLGFDVWLGPGVFGVCDANPDSGTFRDAGLTLARRWNLMMSRKGLPWRSWLVLTRRHMGPLWPLYFAWPYVSLIAGRYRIRK